MPKKFSELKRQFRNNQIKSTLRLLKLSRVVVYAIQKVNSMDGVLIKLMCVLLGFLHDIYVKLYEVSYDIYYLKQAKLIEHQIHITISLLGE